MAVGEEWDQVLAAAQAGADWAFAVLWRDLNPPLGRYLAARAPGVADDLAAETWLAVARQLPAFTGGEGAFRGWLFTIGRRRLIQHWRETGRRSERPTHPDALLDHPGEIDPEGEALGTLSAREAARVIAESLTPDQADVILLRVLAGLDVDQVAEALGKRPGTVRVLQHKALRRLARDFSLEALTL